MCYTTDPGQVHLDLGLCLGLQHLDNGTHMLPHVVLCRITYTTPSWHKYTSRTSLYKKQIETFLGKRLCWPRLDNPG